MFVQIIQGRTSDATGLRRQMELWLKDLKPGAKGWLGTTSGLVGGGNAGETIVIARFESEEAAKANSARPEQGAWWNEMEKYFEGDVTFHDCREVDTFRSGGSDDATFVQVMQGKADRAAMRELDAQFDAQLSNLRPEVIGGTRAWHGDGNYTEAVYFTSQDEARAGESQKLPPEAQKVMDTLTKTVEDLRFLDLPEPWLDSA
jgi:hypothetical protein